MNFEADYVSIMHSQYGWIRNPCVRQPGAPAPLLKTLGNANRLLLLRQLSQWKQTGKSRLSDASTVNEAAAGRERTLYTSVHLFDSGKR